MAEKEKKLIITTTIALAIIIIGAGSIYYFDKKQDKSLSLSNIKIDSQKTGNEQAERIKEDNKDIINTAAKTRTLLPVRAIDATDHIRGEITAPIQMVIYEDFECPFCAGFVSTVEEIKERFGKDVVIAFRHFPLRSHPSAFSAALAAECAAEQDKFWEMYDKLFIANENGSLGEEQYRIDAKDLDLNTDQFEDCLKTEKYKDAIQKNIDEAKNFGITGTPGNFINGIPYPGAIPFDDFIDSQEIERSGMKSIIERELLKIAR